MLFVVEERQLDQIKRLSARLFTERRMDGDERACRQLPVPEAP